MATIRISQLAEITSVTSDDVFVINDGDVNTRKITYSNLTAGLVPKVGDTNMTGDLTVSGTVTAGDLDIASGFFTIDTEQGRIGIGTNAPEQTLDVNGGVMVRSGNYVRFMSPTNQTGISLQAPASAQESSYSLPGNLPAEDGQILASNASGAMYWTTNQSGLVDPMTTAGDIIIRNSNNLLARLGAGTAGQNLVIGPDGVPQWETVPIGRDLAEVTAAGATTTTSISVGQTLTVQGDGVDDGALVLNCSQNSHGVTIKSPSHAAAASYVLTLPNNAGSNNQVLATDGAGNLSWVGNSSDSAASTFTFDASIIPDTNASYDIGSAEYKVRHLYLSQNSLFIGDGHLSEAAGSLIWNGEAVSTGAAHEVKPVVTAVQPEAVVQGQIWTADQLVDSDLVDVVWSFYDYSGPGLYNRASKSGTVGGIENVPGTYTIKGRAAWAFGISDEITLTLQVNPFTLSRDSMFGGQDGLQGRVKSNGEHATYIAVSGAFVEEAPGAYAWDIDGSILPNAANCIGFYDYITDQLVGFRIDVQNNVEGVFAGQNVTALPTQGAGMPADYNAVLTNGAQVTAAFGSSVLGKKPALFATKNVGLGSQHYLSLTSSTGEFNTFGSGDADWSYGFVLADDWVSGGYACQMMSPSDPELAFLTAINGYAHQGSGREFIHFGNQASGALSSDSNGEAWDIAADGWVIARAGDLVTVVYDGTGLRTWRIYVNGVRKFSSTSPDTYMPAVSNPTSLHFGNFPTVTGTTAYPTAENQVAGWYARMDNMFVAVGTAFDQTQVDEMVATKADLTQSVNYGLFTTYGTFDATGVNNVKGNVTYERGNLNLS